MSIMVLLDRPTFDVEVAGKEVMTLQTAAYAQFLANLADDLNNELPDYEVRLIHFDTADYLHFLKQERNQSSPNNPF